MSVLVVLNRPTASGPVPAEPYTIVPPGAPAVDAMDLGITRGDGVFETVGIHDGAVHAVDAHLDRFAHSARLLELPEPDRDAYRGAVELGISLLGDVPDAYCKYVLTRGIEGRDSAPTGYAFLDANPDWSRQREQGIDVVTLSRGYDRDVARTAPWLLQGAKTLSYAVNRAVIREAARRGAEDVIFTTTDGYLLEGPTASLVLRLGDEFVTPDTADGVLHGTAQQGFFDHVRGLGFPAVYRPVPVAELADASGLWLTNSQRLAAPIRTLDGSARPVDRVFTDALNAALLHRTS
jgi:4-amino-4-deoxychorismate lyase